MLFASIDIGSNAVRLLFANAFLRDAEIHVEKASLIRIPVRLGKDVFKDNSISKERADSLIKTLKAFRLLIDVYKPLDFRACATSAMREAINGEDVLKRISTEAGINVDLINGIEEANIIRATNKLNLPDNNKLTMYIDVGGGSTEISVVSKDKLIDIHSFQLGTIRLLEGKAGSQEWDNLQGWLERFRDDFGRINCIGSGGNINKITKLYGRPQENILIYNNLEYAYNHLKSFSLKERMEVIGLRLDRADVILPAAEIFLRILKTVNASHILAPKIGLADGLIHQMFEEWLEKGHH